MPNTQCCSKCGRQRLSYIADPSCSTGGYCNWVDVPKIQTLDPQELYCELGRYLDTKVQGRFGFALVVIDTETQIVSLIHVGLKQEQAAHLCELVAENIDNQPSTQILPKDQMI